MEKKAIEKVMAGTGSKSGKMVEMYNGGLEIAEIAKIMGVRYNFVYNVVSNYCRMNGLKIKTVEKDNKKAKIIELIAAGKSNVEISAEMKVCYNYVFGIRKELERVKK